MHGERDRAATEATIDDSLALASACEVPWVLGAATGSAGVAIAYHGEIARALELTDEAYRISREIGDESQSAFWLNNIGWWRVVNGDLRRARSALEAVVEIAERLGAREATAVSVNNLGWAALLEQSLDEARDHFGRSLAIADEIGYHVGTVWSLLGLAYVATATGDGAAAASLGAAAVAFEVDRAVSLVTEDLDLPPIELVPTDEPPTLRDAVERGLAFAAGET
jgi:hypothetical protein